MKFSTEHLIKLASSKLVSGTSFLLIILHCMNYIVADCVNIFALVTANTLITNTYVWNLLTSCFFETSILKLVSDIATIMSLANYIQINNKEQFFLYFLFSLLACTIGTSTYCFIRFFSTGNEEALIKPIYGFNGVLMTVLMYARQQRRNEPGIESEFNV